MELSWPIELDVAGVSCNDRIDSHVTRVHTAIEIIFFYIHTLVVWRRKVVFALILALIHLRVIRLAHLRPIGHIIARHDGGFAQL